MTQSIADVLDKAADLIAAPGAWTQGRFEKTNPDGSLCYCASGAISVVSQFTPLRMPWRDIQRALGIDSMPELWTWNDEPWRTQEEVVAKLREAASKAREDGL